MRKRFGLATALLVLALGSTAAAAQQPGQAQTEPDILVRGQREQNLQQQIQDFVGALTPGSVQGQLGRFEEGACPVALGFVPSQREAIERRLRTVAQAVGMPLARPGCRANMLVIVANDKRAFLQTLRRQHARFLGSLSSPAFTRLLNEPGPAAAWHLEGQLSVDGEPNDSQFDEGVSVSRSSRIASRVTRSARTYYQAGAVVIEARALAGLTTTQVADYAAMRLFARTTPARLPTPAPPTILSVLDAPMGAEVPVTLTQWDLGFLRGLYRGRNDLSAPAQRGQIGREIRQGVQRPDGAAD